MDNTVKKYDDDPRYEKLEEYVYFDTLTEETVYVTTQQDKDRLVKDLRRKHGLDG
jgi:hypothetical protein